MRDRVEKCEGCIQSRYMNAQRRSKAPLKMSTLQPILWRKIHIDLTSKLGVDGDKIILAVAVDHFSKYCWAVGSYT